MAMQIKVDEVNGCKSYLSWLREKSGSSGALSQVLFDTDFRWTVLEDEIRVTDSLELRKKYAEEIGQNMNKSEREIDRIWKSIHGKCSVFEIILGLCFHMDEMVNEGETGSMVPFFFEILMKNLGISVMDEEDFDLQKEATEAFWKSKIDRFLDRKYESDGSNGGLFVVKNADEDLRNMPIWYQMNMFLEENLDEDGVFLREK